ncbi:MAG TPA: hypothetical protein VL263_09840 [Vicinamibacterales bacterium]|jgi:hypothetical protein|nr:hypothetical protein [Vicinamibacterales bacterium]
MSRTRFVLLVLLLGAVPRPARAQDLLFIPYLGFTFAGSSSLLADLERGSTESASAIGGSFSVVGSRWLGVEGDLSYLPEFFQRGERQLVRSGSFVTTLTGAAVITLPLSITRESLRPYFVGGGGLLWTHAEDIVGLFTIKSTMPAITLGGGAVGFLSNTVGVRFDLRYIRSLGEGNDAIVNQGPRIKFWRAGIGLVLKY